MSEKNPVENTFHTYSHDHPNDTTLKYTRTDHRSELVLTFHSEDHDIGKEEMIYGSDRSETMADLIKELKSDLTSFLDAQDTSSFQRQQQGIFPDSIENEDDYFSEYTRSALYAFESILEHTEQELQGKSVGTTLKGKNVQEKGKPGESFSLGSKMEQAVDRNAEATDELDAIVDQISAFTFSMSREGMMTKEYCAKECGEDVTSLLQELEISDPYELCFALLYLFDDPQRRAAPCTEDRIDVFELPWLYGAGTSFMQLVTQALPWTFEEYEEEYDPVWSPDDEDEEQLSFLQTKNTAPSSQKPILPNFYERRFLSDDDIKRNLAQLIYEETGCVPPRNMEKYAGIVKELRGKGARAKDLPVLLSLITLSGYAQRQHQALNLDQDPLTEKLLSEDKGDQGNTDSNAPNLSASKKDRTKEELLDQVEALQEQAAQYQELNKRLRTAVHDLEQKTRRIEKVLNDTNAAAEMERRELADLRELIFNKENGAEEETEEEIQDAAFPYEVQQDTLIFGGHQTWLRAIRQLLKGNIRFIDKDLNFDVGIVRHADRIWIQTNALSHTQYYRIVDTARTFHKPVRYFAYASALKCARQVAESDTE